MPNTEVKSAWIYLRRAPEIKGWVAYCLSYNIMSQGTTLANALSAVQEAMNMIWGYCTENDVPPFGISHGFKSNSEVPADDWRKIVVAQAEPPNASWDSVVRTEARLLANPDFDRDWVTRRLIVMKAAWFPGEFLVPYLVWSLEDPEVREGE